MCALRVEEQKKRRKTVLAKHIIDNLDIWAREARKYKQSYGNYVRLVERHGMLPPPKPDFERENMQMMTYNHNQKLTHKCVLCGKEEEIMITAHGFLSKSRYCHDCRILRWTEGHRKKKKG
jgi:hypothetical protein